MIENLRILMVEDSSVDAEIIVRELRRAGLSFVVDRVDTEKEMVRRLESASFDVILADYHLPLFDGNSALAVARTRVPDVPFIFVSGSIGEERAVQALNEGASDYVLKDRLARLGPAIQRAHTAARERRARRVSEETIARLHRQNALLLQSAGEGIVGLDAEGRAVFVNPAAARTLGWTVREMVRDGGFHSRIGHVRADGSRCTEDGCPILMTITDGGVRQVTGEAFTRRDSTAFPVDYSCAAVADGDEKSGCVLVFRDVTERHQLERRLEQANRVNSMGRIAATIAHEFNNVLMGIQPFAELLRRRASDERGVRAAEQIMESVKRGKRVTEDILRFTNPAPPSLHAIDLNAFLAALTPELSGHLGSSLQLVIEVSDSPAHATCDALQLQQVLANLVINARDAMAGEGTVRIAVDPPLPLPQAAEGLDEKAFVRIVVIDDGAGIAEDVIHHVFEPLFTTKRTGTGLGLAVAHAAITRAGGHIFVESRPGLGTSFHLLLPRVVAPRQSATSEPAAPSPGPARLLLIDDEVAILEGVAEALSVSGMEVRVLERGAEAVDAIRDFSPDVVVLDVTLQDMSGIEVFDLIAGAWPELPVIFSTGHADEGALGTRLDRPNVAFLRKPYDVDELLATAKRVCAK